MGRKKKSVIEKRKLSFRIIDYKREFSGRKDLMALEVSVDKKNYQVQFLFDSFKMIYYPEFREIESWRSKNPGDAIMKTFINTVQSKIKFFADSYAKMKKEENGINEWDPALEWWQEKDIKLEIEHGINAWISKNHDYLVECIIDEDFPKDESGEEALNEAIDGLVDYLKKRNKFAVPTDMIGGGVEKIDDTFTLRVMLQQAINNEDYFKAAEIRDKLNSNEQNT